MAGVVRRRRRNSLAPCVGHCLRRADTSRYRENRQTGCNSPRAQYPDQEWAAHRRAEDGHGGWKAGAGARASRPISLGNFGARAAADFVSSRMTARVQAAMAMFRRRFGGRTGEFTASISSDSGVFSFRILVASPSKVMGWSSFGAREQFCHHRAEDRHASGRARAYRPRAQNPSQAQRAKRR